MYDILMSCDIGLSGALSFFDTISLELLSVYEFPTKLNDKNKKVIDIDKLHYIMEIPKIHNDSCIVVLEAIHAFGNSGFGVGVLMEEKGIVMGLAKGLGYDQLQIPPKEWQKHFGLVPPKDLKGSTAKKTKYLRRKWLKSNSVIKARELFPEWKNSKLKLLGSDGIADSLLLGKYYCDWAINWTYSSGVWRNNTI